MPTAREAAVGPSCCCDRCSSFQECSNPSTSYEMLTALYLSNHTDASVAPADVSNGSGVQNAKYSPSSKTFTRIVSWAELLENTPELAGVQEAFEEQEIDVDLARDMSTVELRSLMPDKPLGQTPCGTGLGVSARRGKLTFADCLNRSRLTP